MPFCLFDSAGGLIFMAVKVPGGIIVSGSGGLLDKHEHLPRFLEWLSDGDASL